MLDTKQEQDFHYLLTLMPALQSEPEFEWLPELFSTIGHEALIKLCTFAGGETIKIPTIDQLSESIEALQWYYNIRIKKSHNVKDIPSYLIPLVNKIAKVYDTANR